MAGFLLAFLYLVQYMLSKIAVPGYASTIVAVLILGGMQLLALGIVGEYLGRLHLNVNRKPQYVERQVLGMPGPEPGDGTDGSRREDLLSASCIEKERS